MPETFTEDQVRQAPKVLLHDHLDGGLRPSTVIELAAECGYGGLPTTDPDELAAWFTRGADRKSLELYLEGFRHTLAVMQTHDAIERVASDELGLEGYPNRIEVITSEQMLDVYTAHGMPLTYRHWSYGKRSLQHEGSYRRGYTSLAYEVVINSNPCITYLLEENTATMQALVIAHAAFGHNHFFRNNHLFRQWTEASAILDYLEFARSYVASCEDRYGAAAVERVLDAAHALSRHGVHRHGGGRALNLKTDQRRERERREYDERVFDDLWRTVPGARPAASADPVGERRRRLGLSRRSEASGNAREGIGELVGQGHCQTPPSNS